MLLLWSDLCYYYGVHDLCYYYGVHDLCYYYGVIYATIMDY